MLLNLFRARCGPIQIIKTLLKDGVQLNSVMLKIGLEKIRLVDLCSVVAPKVWGCNQSQIKKYLGFEPGWISGNVRIPVG